MQSRYRTRSYDLSVQSSYRRLNWAVSLIIANENMLLMVVIEMTSVVLADGFSLVSDNQIWSRRSD